MEHLPLSPATQAILKALAELGQGTVHELAEKSGKARSTTDRAIKTLADAGLIVAVDTGADLAEGTPARWTLSEDATAALEAADLTDEPAVGADEPDLAGPDSDNTGDVEPSGTADNAGDHPATDGVDNAADAQQASGGDASGSDDSDDADAMKQAEDRTVVLQSARPGDRKVMAVKGVLADHSDGATIEVIVAESGISHPTAMRLLAAMEQADAARRLPGQPERWIPGPTKASEVDPNPEPPRCPLCLQVIRGVTSTPSAVAAVQTLIRPDGTLHIVGPDEGIHVVTLPTRLPPRAPGNPGVGIRRSDVTVNADGSQPFARGELEKLTIAILAANPGRPMTPQEIATAIGAQLGRTVSSGAVRNNCTKAAAAGSILLVSETPLTFVLPVPADDGNAGSETDRPVQTANGIEAAAGTGEQADNQHGGNATEQS
jgi:DNA-binding transcriptional ArsR family regulator